MPSLSSLADVAVAGRLGELHDRLLETTRDRDEPPPELLAELSVLLREVDVENEGLTPRPLVALRLLRADVAQAAWLVLKDNAVGVVEETFRQSTSSGIRRTSPRLPLSTRVDPPTVYAWLPGFRDPRYAAPESAYDITALVTPRVRLDELWWDRGELVLAGSAHLRNLTATPDDEVEIVLTHPSGRRQVCRGERRRRPDLVRGTGGDLTRLAWTGWSARVDPRRLPAGEWRLALRLTQSGIVREVGLGRAVGDAVPLSVAARVRRRRAEVVLRDRRLELRLIDPKDVRARRRVLHVIAHAARRR